jgi:hypothetical protein
MRQSLLTVDYQSMDISATTMCAGEQTQLAAASSRKWGMMVEAFDLAASKPPVMPNQRAMQ